MIRSTQNEGLKTTARSVQGETYETVMAGASEGAAVTSEKREIDTPSAYQTTTPSNDFNGTQL